MANVCGVVCATWAIRRDGEGEWCDQHLVVGRLVNAQSLRQYPEDDCATEIVSYSHSFDDVCDGGDGVWARQIVGDGGSVEAWMP